MGFIKEPEGVDFVIKGEPLTESQKQIISDFIKADKAQKASAIIRRGTQNGCKKRAGHTA
ncbi:hypothetical protein [Spirosoma montaniterrae]|uniref:Uncharacterized protein n=1 Tax=Spirosoma montaniterrae TaxID=1178516 RepID=A0A1P9WYQ1_9BACT|nr:hypothetical protein [Spirosoma montaniterrae]AQG80506.1 hypothetical protein AWR27_14955 [Spirosoma montaniterrae]